MTSRTSRTLDSDAHQRHARTFEVRTPGGQNASGRVLERRGQECVLLVEMRFLHRMLLQPSLFSCVHWQGMAAKNVLGTALQCCCTSPKTGYYR